jgi:hypothetical protein
MLFFFRAVVSYSCVLALICDPMEILANSAGDIPE